MNLIKIKLICIGKIKEEFYLPYILGYFDYIDEKYQFNKMPNKYNEYTSNHIIDYSASWMGTTRLFAYLGEWLVSNYIVTKFNQNSIKYLHKHDYLTN